MAKEQTSVIPPATQLATQSNPDLPIAKAKASQDHDLHGSTMIDTILILILAKARQSDFSQSESQILILILAKAKASQDPDPLHRPFSCSTWLHPKSWQS